MVVLPVPVAPVTAGAGAVTAGGVEIAAAGGCGAKPSPAAYKPHNAWLNDATSPVLGWLVNRASTSSPRTSVTNPCNAFFGPTSTKTRAPAAWSVRSPFTNCTGEATCRARMSSICSSTSSPVG